jgi:hypothetical protein
MILLIVVITLKMVLTLINNENKLDIMFLLLVKNTLSLSKCFAFQGFIVRCALYYSANHSKHYSKTFKRMLGIYSKRYSSTKRDKRFIDSAEEQLRVIYNSIT